MNGDSTNLLALCTEILHQCYLRKGHNCQTSRVDLESELVKSP